MKREKRLALHKETIQKLGSESLLGIKGGTLPTPVIILTLNTAGIIGGYIYGISTE